MIIKKIRLENYTVFENQQLEFLPGINVFIGENGTGKTHIMKALYSACQSVSKKISFSHKLVSTMLPRANTLRHKATYKAFGDFKITCNLPNCLKHKRQPPFVLALDVSSYVAYNCNVNVTIM